MPKYLDGAGLSHFWNNIKGSIGSASQEQVDAWLDNHPEATTTVQDGAIATLKLADGAVTDEKLAQTGGVLDRVKLSDVRAAEAYPYVNLIDKDSANRRDGAFVNYMVGIMGLSSEYSTYVIPVIAGKKISGYMLKYAHIAFFSDYPDIWNKTPESEVVGAYVSGFTVGDDGIVNGETVPSNARYVTVSCHNSASELPYTVIQYSNASTGNDGYTRSPFEMEKLLAKKADISTGKNILDLKSNAKSGIFAGGGNGYIGTSAEYGIALVRVNAGDVLSFNSYCDGAHVNFVSAWQDMSSLVDGNRLAGFISGFANEAKQNFTVPDGAVAMAFSYQLARANLVQVEKASASTSYEPYWRGFPLSDVHGILTVGAGMKYATISDAVAAASESDIVLVFPGTYNEYVKAWGKYVNIIGTSRDECILTYGGGNYSYPPLEMSHGTLANMTIHTTYETQTGADPAYCMHVEDNTADGSTLNVSNVRFVNDQHQAVGIGLRNHHTVRFENCDFECNAQHNALYCHDHETATTGENDQHIQLINCSFKSNGVSQPTIHLQSQEIENNRATCLFQRCIVKNTAGGPEIGMTKWGGRSQGGGNFLDSTDWLLDEMSALNTLATINA